MRKNKFDLTKMPTADLVREFTELSIHEHNAVLWFDTKRYNKLFAFQRQVVAELKRRGERDRLIPLYDHPNVWVRVMAAKSTLAVAPEKARKLLEDIHATKHVPEAPEAGMCLFALDKGIFVPD
jgi:predicted GNAT superfamily acetyltransferase